MRHGWHVPLVVAKWDGGYKNMKHILLSVFTLNLFITGIHAMEHDPDKLNQSENQTQITPTSSPQESSVVTRVPELRQSRLNSNTGGLRRYLFDGRMLIDASQHDPELGPDYIYTLKGYQNSWHPYVTLYRGIGPDAGHQHGRDLRQEAILDNQVLGYDPQHGHTDCVEHHQGSNVSQFSSWTYSKKNATECFASEVGGIIVQGNFQKGEIKESPNMYNEKEILVRGNVENFNVFLVVHANPVDGEMSMLEITDEHRTQIRDCMNTGLSFDDAIHKLINDLNKTD